MGPFLRAALAIVALTFVSLVLLACGEDEDSSVTAGAEEVDTAVPEADPQSKPDRERAKPRRPDGTELVIAESQYGPILFGPGRQAIYLFDRESGSRSECYGACAAAWPPVLTDGEPVAGDGVDADLLGTTERDDGTAQVTYDGQPLYYYVDDPPGEVLCHNVAEFGGLWLVLGADGRALA